MKDNKLTAKELRLVEMVQTAMREEDVDYSMGRQDDPNQLPNPAPELNIPEGEESIEEVKPLPKYNSIEELMKEIEHGTNEAAHKYKMDEMKRVYEALETKVSSLEEGENAEHIDQKKVKQMRKDIAALRKAEERLRKDFDKKFSGKEKKEAPKKEIEALQENRKKRLLRSRILSENKVSLGNTNTMERQFDLKKFLVENKLTNNSRTVIKENSDMDEKMQFFMDFMEQYASGMDEGSILEMLEDSYDIPENVDMRILERATSELDMAINDIYTAIFESDNY